MSNRGEQALQAVLALPPAERAELVELVLASLDDPHQREIDRAWAVEAEDRIDAFERGEMSTVPASEVFARRNRANG